jgi:molecular chaperone IbpA
MRSYDLTPLFRTSVGFDRMSRLMDTAMQQEGNTKRYPPYNIVKSDENAYQIVLAVAGFGLDDLNIESKENILTITGRHEGTEPEMEYLYRGIAGRAFERRFQLADHIRVLGARLEKGLLHITLEREIPEALKPRSIPITAHRPDAIAAK